MPFVRTTFPALALRAFGVVLAALLVAGQLAALGHLALVEHALCAEHGEIVHDEGAGPLRSPPAESVALCTPGARDDSTHEHCLCLARVPEPLALIEAHERTLPALLLAEQHAALARGVALPPSVPLLSLAPKQSPPPA